MTERRDAAREMLSNELHEMADQRVEMTSDERATRH